MITTEKAFDLLPYVADIYTKTDIKKYVTEKRSKVKAGDDAMILGLDLFSYIMKQSPKVKGEFYNIVAILEDKKVEEIKAQSFAKTIAAVKTLFEDKEILAFFKSAV